MSNSTVAGPVYMQTAANRRHNIDQETRGARNQRSAGKGRRRRAAAEQRRIDQQRWGQYIQDSDEELVVASRNDHRRRNRRSGRCDSRADSHDDSSLDASDDNLSLDVALALSLSLYETGGDARSGSEISHGIIDMSYENLVLLENVKCVAPPLVVNSLVSFTFEGSLYACIPTELEEENCGSLRETEELCAICQTDYKKGDHLMKLPCAHDFHHSCGSEWLLNYSKLCPVCKHDITNINSTATDHY